MQPSHRTFNLQRLTMKTFVTCQRLVELLNYDPETGLFTWKKHRQRCFVGKQTYETTSSGYISIRIDGDRHLAHRLAWMYVYGVLAKKSLDHINGIPSDNRICNLRECTHAENHQNRGMQSNNKSGFPGVSWHKARNNWRSVIAINQKSTHLGSFSTPEAAYAAYCKAKAEIHLFQPKHR